MNFLKFFRKISQCRKLSHSAENESFHIFIHCRTHSARARNRGFFGSQTKSSVTRVVSQDHTRLSATNQKRVLRNPSRQPIRIEHPSCHYVTRELSARPEDPSRLSVRVGCYSLSLYMEGPPAPLPDQLTLLLLML